MTFFEKQFDKLMLFALTLIFLSVVFSTQQAFGIHVEDLLIGALLRDITGSVWAERSRARNQNPTESPDEGGNEKQP